MVCYKTVFTQIYGSKCSVHNIFMRNNEDKCEHICTGNKPNMMNVRGDRANEWSSLITIKNY